MSDKPIVTYNFGGTSLFNAMNTVHIIEQQDKLEAQLRTTALATRMLNEIGVKCK